MDYKELTAKKRRRTRTVWVLLDDELVAERDQLVVQVGVAERQDAWQNRRPEAPAMRERILELEIAIAEQRVPFVFGAMPRTRWNELVEEFTDDDDELDVEGFGPYLLSESAIDPVMTLEDVADMFTGDVWSPGETEALYMAAYRVNREIRDVPFTNAVTAATANSEPNSTTALPEE
jgi:hypothetical protein